MRIRIRNKNCLRGHAIHLAYIIFFIILSLTSGNAWGADTIKPFGSISFPPYDGYPVPINSTMTATGTARDNETGIRVVQFFDQTTSPPTYLFDGTLAPYPCNAGVNCSWTTTVSFPSRFKAGDLYTFRIKTFDRADPVFPYTNANIKEYFRTICLSGTEILNDGIDQDCNGSDLVDRAAPSVTIDSITVNGNPVSGVVGYNDRIVVSGRAIDPSSDLATGTNTATGIGVIQVFDATPTPNTYLFDASKSCSTTADCNWQFTLQFPGSYSTGTHYTFKVKVFDKVNPTFPYDGSNIGYAWGTLCLSGTEVCNGVDDNCNGQVDEGIADVVTGTDVGACQSQVVRCSYGSFQIVQSAIGPTTETCNNVDDDCDGSTDESLTRQTTCGVGACANNTGAETCTTGAWGGNTCNPTAGALPEVCDGADNDCNGVTDNGVQNTYYRDADTDTYGNAVVTTQACTVPPGYVSNNADCNDSNNNIHPGANEVCNAVDDNCNGQVDEGIADVVTGTDVGACQSQVDRCISGSFQIVQSAIGPTTETCNNVDDDCDGSTDESLTRQTTCGVGACVNNTGAETCTTGAWGGNTCNPTAGATPEVCDGADNDCNSVTDNGVQNTYYRDADTDTYGSSGVTTLACTVPPGYVPNSTDCDDGNIQINPGATEKCDGIDNNCNLQTDEGFPDLGNQCVVGIGACMATGTNVCSGDNLSTVCNATPGTPAAEACNGLDDNCNGTVDDGVQNTYYQDEDGDLYGNVSVSAQACTVLIGYAGDNTDCNDSNAAINPGAAEVCGNVVDDNCNNQVDEGCNLSADLSITNVDLSDPIMPAGQDVTYTITITNSGPTSATGVTVTDVLDASLILVSATPSQGAPCTGTGTITCNLGSMINGSSATVTVVATTSTTPGMIGSTASVTATASDPNTANNSATQTTNIGDISREVGISTRGYVETGTNIMVGGFSFGGTVSKKVLIRGRGPSMSGAPYNFTDTLTNPTLEIYSGTTLFATVDDWQAGATLCNAPAETCGPPSELQVALTDPCQPNAGQTTAPPGCMQEAALYITLPPGAYTVKLKGVLPTDIGKGIMEVYDADTTSLTMLGGISTRGKVLTGSNVMVGGFIVGAGSTNKTLLLRGRGPSLSGAPYNFTGTLTNPELEIYSGPTLFATVDDWQSGAAMCNAPAISCGTPSQLETALVDPCQPNVGQTTPPPGCTQESAMFITLPPGAYTAKLKGVNNDTGIGIFEVYEMAP